MSKSHVSVEQKICVVIGKPYDAGILLDRRLKNSLEPTTLTGWGLCPEVKEKIDAGFIAMVEVDESKSIRCDDGKIKPQDAYRLGGVAYLKREVFGRIFNCDGNKVPDVVYTDTEVMEYLKKLDDECES